MRELGRRFLRRFGPPLARSLARSWRIEVAGAERGEAVLGSGRAFLLLTWHEALLPVLWHHRNRGIAAVVSEANDGDSAKAQKNGSQFHRVILSRQQSGTLLLKPESVAMLSQAGRSIVANTLNDGNSICVT